MSGSCCCVFLMPSRHCKLMLGQGLVFMLGQGLVFMLVTTVVERMHQMLCLCCNTLQCCFPARTLRAGPAGWDAASLL